MLDVLIVCYDSTIHILGEAYIDTVVDYMVRVVAYKLGAADSLQQQLSHLRIHQRVSLLVMHGPSNPTIYLMSLPYLPHLLLWNDLDWLGAVLRALDVSALARLILGQLGGVQEGCPQRRLQSLFIVGS